MSETSTLTAQVTVRTGYVHPSDLEVSWETTDQGEVYTWVQVKHSARPELEVQEHVAPSFDVGLRLASHLVAAHAKNTGRLVPVVQVNVTEASGMSFVATALEPAEGFKVL
jgi:hypothetical protein